MSTREKVNVILDKMSEKQLLAILGMFEECFSANTADSENANEFSEEELKKRREAFDYIEKIRKPYVGADDKTELAEARDERYGL